MIFLAKPALVCVLQGPPYDIIWNVQLSKTRSQVSVTIAVSAAADHRYKAGDNTAFFARLAHDFFGILEHHVTVVLVPVIYPLSRPALKLANSSCSDICVLIAFVKHLRLRLAPEVWGATINNFRK
jgi:hypothetical protein